MKCEHRHAEGKDTGQNGTWRHTKCRRNSKCQGPGSGTGLGGSKSSEFSGGAKQLEGYTVRGGRDRPWKTP